MAIVIIAVFTSLVAPVLGACFGCEGRMARMTCANNDGSHAAYTSACCCSMRGSPKTAALPEAIFPMAFQVAGLESMPIVVSELATIKIQLMPALLRHVGASQFSNPKNSISILKQSFLI